MTTPAKTIRLSDYTPPNYLIDNVDLTFKLHPTATRVISKIAFRPNPDAHSNDFFLHGQDLTLIGAKIDGALVKPTLTADGLKAEVPIAPFVWEAEVEIDPQSNTSLNGLYMSNGMYCTQCEAEGFRKITYYPDRPDVMTTFSVTIKGDAPVLLSNGNLTSRDHGNATWHDPWPKPAYLFALVAGNLVSYDDTFTTMSGRKVDLKIYVRPGDEDKCAYAMDALIRSMRWDETEYGREYDLDLFMIVAVDDFNMGAMENKGLNIFNSKYVLASPETATDRDYELIEGIIAHEYFHNWTGNRITCRDWFQLCLKEGLTVFRDQQFSGDMRSHAVGRIENVLQLRGRQFREDNGPLAHPVRPESYIEINNFYTATVYEKGAELIGMLKTLVGDAGYAKALNLYFDRHDGDAATIEDWLQVFEDATGRDLKQFKRWYSDAGTPRVTVTEAFNNGTYKLTFKQDTPPTPGQKHKKPRVIPITVGLLDSDGTEIRPTTVLELTKNQQSFKFENLAEAPTASILRNFSAPVILTKDTSAVERAFLLAHDTDPFNKFESGRALAKDVLIHAITDHTATDPLYLDALKRVATDDTLDPAFRALALHLPSEDDLAQTLHDSGVTPDPLTIHSARSKLTLEFARHAGDELATLYDAMAVPGPYTPNAKDAGKRALRGAALGYLSRLDDGKRARAQFDSADNMTEQLGALGKLISNRQVISELDDFYRQWQADRLVIDKWFMLQVTQCDPSIAVETAQSLTKHSDFDLEEPKSVPFCYLVRSRQMQRVFMTRPAQVTPCWQTG